MFEKLLWWLVPIMIVVILIILGLSRRENFSTGPLYINVPENLNNTTYGYINYADFPFADIICPSLKSKEPVLCQSNSDCGPSEKCSPGWGTAVNTCLCMISNNCIEEGVC